VNVLLLNFKLHVIWSFRRDVDDICTLMGDYSAKIGNSLRTFRDNLSVPSSRVNKSLFLGFLPLKDGTEMLPRNVCKELPFYAEY